MAKKTTAAPADTAIKYKPGDKVTDADGTIWFRTQGNHWRAENGPKKGQLFSGSGDPTAAPPAAPAATTPEQMATSPVGLDTAPPSQLSPDGQAFLDDTKAQLQKQVDSGAINQAQANYEYSRREKEVLGLSPALQSQKWKQQQLTNSGQQTQAQADKNVYDAQTNENRTAPNTNTVLTPESTSKDIINEVNDVSKHGTVAETVLKNPNEVNDFGSKTVTVDPVTGQPTVTTELSPENKKVLEGVQHNAIDSNAVLNTLIKDKYGNFVDAAGPQSGYSDPALEEAVFKRLTSRFGDEKRRGQEQVEQTLANRGIPIGSEAYSNVTRDFNNTWNDRYDAAQQQAVEMGTSTALQRQQNNIGGLGAFVGGLGTLGAVGQSGLYQPNFQNFESGTYNQPDVENIFGQLMNKYLTEKGYQTQVDLQNDQQKFQADQAAKARAAAGGGGGGGGGGGPRPKPAPFGSTVPGS
jgi:hypothetical protein